MRGMVLLVAAVVASSALAFTPLARPSTRSVNSRSAVLMKTQPPKAPLKVKLKASYCGRGAAALVALAANAKVATAASYSAKATAFSLLGKVTNTRRCG